MIRTRMLPLLALLAIAAAPGVAASATYEWTVLATDGKGSVCGSQGPDLATAKHDAIHNCAPSGVVIVETRENCAAWVEHKASGYYVYTGIASNEKAAKLLATKFCVNKHGRGCGTPIGICNR